MKSKTPLLPSLLFTAALLGAASSAQAALDPPCQAKFDAISQEIDAATAAGHKHKIRGLEKARNEVNTSCTQAKLQTQRDRDIASQEKKVAQRQHDLDKAQHDGKSDKIATRQNKLDEERAALQRLKDKPL